MKDEERIFEIQSNANKGNPSNYSHSNETKEVLSKGKLGELNPQYGKSAPNNGVKRPGIGGRNKGTKWSDSERAAHEAARSKPGYYDYTQDPERNRKISEARKGKPGNAKGKKWYNNGKRETYVNLGTEEEGFVLGRLSRK